MQPVAQQAVVEVEKRFLAAQDILQSDGEQGARDYLFSGAVCVGAVELVARPLGTVEQLVSVKLTLAVKDRLTRYEYIHNPVYRRNQGKTEDSEDTGRFLP